jgi:DNA-binding XRE family transcriptional regulator
MAKERYDRLYELVGDRVRKARDAVALSQAKLALKVGVNRVSIVNIEKGRQHPPLDLLWRIAEALRIELIQLVPRNADFEVAATGVQLSPDDLKAIQGATKGDVAAARQITEFVRQAKSKTQNQI